MTSRPRLAVVCFVSAVSLLPGLLVAADAVLTRDRFMRLELAAGRSVDAIRLLDADDGGSGFVAWLEGADLKAAVADELPGVAAAPGQPSPMTPGYIKGRVLLTWRKNEIQRGLYDVARSTRFTFADKKDELEFACVLLPGGGDANYRAAVAWRVKRGGKVQDSGSSVFVLADGSDAPITLQGRSEPAFTAKFEVASK